MPIPSPEADVAPRSHARNASHSIASPGLKVRPGLKQKKSLPDLRQNHAQILDERLAVGTSSSEPDSQLSPASVSSSAGPRSFQDSNLAPRPNNLGHSSSARAAIVPGAQASQIPLARSYSDRPSVTTQVAKFAETQRAPGRQPESPAAHRSEEKTPLADDTEQSVVGGLDRNSGAYFRRLSMLPASSISKAVPLALLHFIDAIRSILFSLSQIHSALKQFVVFATHDGFLPGALAKVMASADASMGRLIDSLDRFDSSARRSAPDGSVVKEVFENCRDNVGVFSKLVSVLAIQLKVLVYAADVRYTRTLLLMLYGSMGEVARSWNVMASMSHGIKAMIDDPTATITLHPPTPSPGSDASSTSVPGQAVFSAVASTRSAVPVVSGHPPANANKSKARRHAGSFSVEDVQLGAAMPPASSPSEPLPPLPSHTTSALSSPSSAADHAQVPSPATPTIQPSVVSPSGSSPTSMKIRPGAPRAVPLPAPPVTLLSTSTPPNNATLYADIFTHLNEMPPTPVSAFGPMIPSPAPPPSSSDLSSSYAPSVLSPTQHQYPQSSASGNSLLAATSLSSPAATPMSRASTGGGRPTTPRSVGTRGVDEDFLDMVDATTNIAFSVCNMLTESLLDTIGGDLQSALSDRGGSGNGTGTGPGSPPSKKVKELLELCETGNEVSRRLRMSLAKFREGGGSDDEGGGFRWSRASLGLALAESNRIWDDSNAFAKVCVVYLCFKRD
jgi:hypothetical protein